MSKFDDAFDKHLLTAQAAVARYFGNRPLPAGILAKLAWQGGLMDGKYVFRVFIRPKRDGRASELEVGEVIVTAEDEVVAVKITPEAEALRVEASG